jgi:hypothetical protein
MTAMRPSSNARTKLFDAALFVIRAKGHSATAVDDICGFAGVSKGASSNILRAKKCLRWQRPGIFHRWQTAYSRRRLTGICTAPLARLRSRRFSLQHRPRRRQGQRLSSERQFGFPGSTGQVLSDGMEFGLGRVSFHKFVHEGFVSYLNQYANELDLSFYDPRAMDQKGVGRGIRGHAD